MPAHPRRPLPAPLVAKAYVPLVARRVPAAAVPGAVTSDERSRMLHMIVNTHNAESCAFRGEEEAELLVGAVDRFQESAPERGLTVEGAWVNRAAHEIFLLVDAPHAHAIEDALLDAGVVGRTHSRVLPVVATEQA